MGFVKVERPPKKECRCSKPDSKQGKFFGPGTVWRCDNCGQAYEFVKANHYSDQRDGDYWTDEWKRSPNDDGPDNRPMPDVPMVDRPAPGVYGPNRPRPRITGPHY